MPGTHGYTDAELDAADAEMAGCDESMMAVGGHLAPDQMPGPIALTEAEYARVLDILEHPPRPTAALVALLRQLRAAA